MLTRIIKGIIEVICRETKWFKIRKQYKHATGRLVRANKWKGVQI